MAPMGDVASGWGGLTESEAAERLRQGGPNELASDRRPGLLRSALGILKEPMLLLLLAGGGVYLVLGDLEGALTLLFFVLVVIVIALVQERKTERAVAALRDLTSPRALVVRDGARRRIPGRVVVPGDVLVLAEGDRVPADSVLVEGAHLEADESLLTGEPVPVTKRAAPEGAAPRKAGDDPARLCAGTLVVRGRGTARVTATGARSRIGKIGTALAELEPGRTRLELEVARLVKVVATVGLREDTLAGVELLPRRRVEPPERQEHEGLVPGQSVKSRPSPGPPGLPLTST